MFDCHIPYKPFANLSMLNSSGEKIAGPHPEKGNSLLKFNSFRQSGSGKHNSISHFSNCITTVLVNYRFEHFIIMY